MFPPSRSFVLSRPATAIISLRSTAGCAKTASKSWSMTRDNPDMEAQPDRMLALDAFRGVTIAGMILVNHAGTSEPIYWPLEHAAWNGWTPTDLVFPFFLFIVGVAITLALGRPRPGIYAKILRRSAIIFAL